MDRRDYHYLRRRLNQLMGEHRLLQRQVPSDPYPKLAQREASAALRAAHDIARQIRAPRDAYTADVNDRWAGLNHRLCAHVAQRAKAQRVARELAIWGVYCQRHGITGMTRALGTVAIEWGNATAAERIALVTGEITLGVAA